MENFKNEMYVSSMIIVSNTNCNNELIQHLKEAIDEEKKKGYAEDKNLKA